MSIDTSALIWYTAYNMYAGTTIHGKSGAVMGVHQKIDRISRRHLKSLIKNDKQFPGIRAILHFEGNNGPDAIKRKSPSVDEPWHYINPEVADDRELVNMINDHYDNLVAALRAENHERAAFEAAWMAHAITDGLTPAHHYPLSEKIEELWGKPKEERLTIRDKNIIPGNNRRETISKNWQYWGAKGVFLTHGLFEHGIATSIVAGNFSTAAPKDAWLRTAATAGLENVFLNAVHEIYALDMYERFWKQGWNARLARETRTKLIPLICNVITFAWQAAYKEALGGKH